MSFGNYYISHSYEESCTIIFSEFEPIRREVCFNHTSEQFGYNVTFSDGHNMIEVIDLSEDAPQPAQPSEVFITDLTGSSNLHYDVYLNITQTDDIHLTGFLD